MYKRKQEIHKYRAGAKKIVDKTQSINYPAFYKSKGEEYLLYQRSDFKKKNGRDWEAVKGN